MTWQNVLLDQRYRLQVLIAGGGMGEVWRAMDELLGRPVAVKILHPHFLADPQFRTRFRSEARIAAGLSHPGIAAVYDYGEQDDFAYLVMELVRGEPLSALLGHTGPLTPEVTLDLVAQAARALHAAHEAGVVHRDVKPANLLVTVDGVVKVTDFGIARAAHGTAHTQTGMVMGTAAYVSPEQASGQPLTYATDIYSLGVVAYECLAGRPPFSADSAVALALAHVNAEPPPLPDYVPDPVQELVAAMLAKRAEDRPPAAAEVVDRAYQLRDSLAMHGGGLSTLGLVTETEPEIGAQPGETANTEDVPAVAPTFQGEYDRTRMVPAGYGDATEGYQAPSRRRRSWLLAVTLGLAILLLGFIMIGALLQDPRDGRIGEQTGGGVRPLVPVDSSPTPGESVTPSPSRTPPTTRPPRRQTPSATPTRSVTPTSSPSPSPTTASPSPTTTSPSPSPPDR